MSWTRKAGGGARVLFTPRGLHFSGKLDMTRGQVVGARVTLYPFDAQGYEAGMMSVRPEMLEFISLDVTIDPVQLKGLVDAFGEVDAERQMELPGFQSPTVSSVDVRMDRCRVGGQYCRPSAENIQLDFPISGVLGTEMDTNSVDFSGEVAFKLSVEGMDWWNEVFNRDYSADETEEDRQMAYDVAVVKYTVSKNRG